MRKVGTGHQPHYTGSTSPPRSHLTPAGNVSSSSLLLGVELKYLPIEEAHSVLAGVQRCGLGLYMTSHKKRVVAVVSDLLFTVKIADAAKRSGMQAQFVKTDTEALAAAAENPMLVIVDLNCASCDPISLINNLKHGKTRLPVIGFVSHVEVELKKKAQEAGADMVMARSAFSTNLPQILKRHAGAV